MGRTWANPISLESRDGLYHSYNFDLACFLSSRLGGKNLAELDARKGSKRVVQSPLKAVLHTASAPWPCDLAHLCKLIAQLHLGVAFLGLGRELQDLAFGKTLWVCHPTPVHLWSWVVPPTPLPLTSLAWVSLLSHLTLLCYPALAQSPKASDVLVPHIGPPLPKGFLLLRCKLLHPPRGYGVRGKLALEKTFFISQGKADQPQPLPP